MNKEWLDLLDDDDDVCDFPPYTDEGGECNVESRPFNRFAARSVGSSALSRLDQLNHFDGFLVICEAATVGGREGVAGSK